MKRLEALEREKQKTQEKIAVLQNRLKEIDGQRTEQENLQIIQQVRALKLSQEELYQFIRNGKLPVSANEAGNFAAEPERIYSRRGNKSEAANENHESEGLNHEE